MQLTYKGWFWKYRRNKHQGPHPPKNNLFSEAAAAAEQE
jgi:hypothetical protein